MSNSIHPTAVVGPDVELGSDNTIGPFAVIVGRTTIGSGNWFGPHTVIGTPPEVYSAPHGETWNESGPGPVRIGSRNVVHEFANIQAGSAGETVIGDDCFLMTQAHVAHDCVIGDRVTISSGVTLGGHVEAASLCNIGMGSVVHQRTRLGPGAMIGMGSAVRKDCPPFTIAVGNPARVTGINVIGLQRNGCDEALIEELTDHLVRSGPMPSRTPTGVANLLTTWNSPG